MTPRPVIFSRVIDTYGPAIANITNTPGTPEHLATLTPRQFVDLVGDASRRLLASGRHDQRAAGADLHQAWQLLARAVTQDGAARSNLLNAAAEFLLAADTSTILS